MLQSSVVHLWCCDVPETDATAMLRLMAWAEATDCAAAQAHWAEAIDWLAACAQRVGQQAHVGKQGAGVLGWA